LPLALIVALPFGWVYAFYQNVTAIADGEDGELGSALKRSFRQSVIWPGQNHVILFYLGAFGFCIFLNLVTVCFALPYLLKMLLGIESVYTQSPLSMLNTTFFAAMFSLTYLCVDPLIKTVYLLRCFYGESLQSGEDLSAELKALTLSAGRISASLLLLLFLACATSLKAADAPPSPPAPPANVSPAKLDQAIDEVIHQTKYTWRMPREKLAQKEAAEQGLLARFFTKTFKTIKGWFKSLGKWIQNLLDKWFKRREQTDGESSRSTDWMGLLQTFLFVLLAIVACVLAVFLFRVFQRRRRREASVASEAIMPIPDIADENVGAEQLPEDGWIKLGRELLERGELRLALRAFYFASLAHLAARSLITIARFKSNRDYERELGRRGHSLPELLSQFGENVSVFDRSWYGTHEVNQQVIVQFVSNVERIKGV
jgi:hypothetical protein